MNRFAANMVQMQLRWVRLPTTIQNIRHNDNGKAASAHSEATGSHFPSLDPFTPLTIVNDWYLLAIPKDYPRWHGLVLGLRCDTCNLTESPCHWALGSGDTVVPYPCTNCSFWTRRCTIRGSDVTAHSGSLNKLVASSATSIDAEAAGRLIGTLRHGFKVMRDGINDAADALEQLRSATWSLRWATHAVAAQAMNGGYEARSPLGRMPQDNRVPWNALREEQIALGPDKLLRLASECGPANALLNQTASSSTASRMERQVRAEKAEGHGHDDSSEGPIKKKLRGK